MRKSEHALISAALLCAVACGCGTNEAGGGGQTTSSTSHTGLGGGGAGGSVGTGGDAILAIREMWLGDTLPDGNPSGDAWREYGLNLDGKVSTKAFDDLCVPAAGALVNAVHPDGDNGIDNGFGKNVVPILVAFANDLSALANQSIGEGRFSVLVRIQGVGPGDTGTFPAQLFTGGFPPQAYPAWSSTDVWPVRSDSLVGGDLGSPRANFKASVVGNDNDLARRYWWSVSGGDLDVVLDLAGYKLKLPIKNAQLYMELSEKNTEATVGQIGGLLDTEAFIKELIVAFAAAEPLLCPPSSTLESIAVQIRQAQDILSDGSQDPQKTCDAISIGIGFNAQAALLGDVFTPDPVPDPCNP